MNIYNVIFDNVVTGEEKVEEVIAFTHSEALSIACKDLPSVYGDGFVYLAGPAFRRTIGA